MPSFLSVGARLLPPLSVAGAAVEARTAVEGRIVGGDMRTGPSVRPESVLSEAPVAWGVCAAGEAALAPKSGGGEMRPCPGGGGESQPSWFHRRAPNCQA